MNKTVIAIFIAASATAAAAPGAELSLDAFLEQRVPDELAADGTLLSRIGIALDVETVADKVIVSLVDPATRRVIASTKVDQVPVDREAAVAQVTQVAANLVAQLSGGVRVDIKVTGDTGVPANPVDELKRHGDAEYRYRQEMVTFERGWGISGDKNRVSSYTYTQPVLGELKRPLRGCEFYLAVDRPDLASEYSKRRRRGWIGALGGPLVTASGVIALAIGDDASNAPLQITGGVMTVAGVVGFFGGLWYLWHSHPVDESEWYGLAQHHNATVRRKYGLSVGVAPYAHADGGGLSFAGSF
jgi:hypothetical protein